MVGGIAIAIVGILMIKEGVEDTEEDETLLLKKGMVLILGVSVSIDAFVVGFTGFNYISNALMMIGDCSIVGRICKDNTQLVILFFHVVVNHF